LHEAAEPEAAEGEILLGLDALAFAQGAPAEAPASTERRSLDAAIAALETRLIAAALTEARDNRSEAARNLGISRVGLLKKMARLGLR